MAQNQGIVPIRGTSAAVGTKVEYTIYDQAGSSLGSGYVVPITSGIQISHVSSRDNILNGDGEVAGTGAWGEYLEATFTFIPSAASAADSLKSATIPPLMSTVVITAADVIAVGSFSNAINSNSGSRWIYEGGGSLSLTSAGQASLTLPLRRYPLITGGAAIAS